MTDLKLLTLPFWQLQVYSTQLLPSLVLLNTVKKKKGHAFEMTYLKSNLLKPEEYFTVQLKDWT